MKVIYGKKYSFSDETIKDMVSEHDAFTIASKKEKLWIQYITEDRNNGSILHTGERIQLINLSGDIVFSSEYSVSPSNMVTLYFITISMREKNVSAKFNFFMFSGENQGFQENTAVFKTNMETLNKITWRMKEGVPLATLQLTNFKFGEWERLIAHSIEIARSVYDEQDSITV